AQPGGEQGGLAVAGGRGDQGELAGEPGLEAGEQGGAGHQVGREARRNELGAERARMGFPGQSGSHLLTHFRYCGSMLTKTLPLASQRVAASLALRLAPVGAAQKGTGTAFLLTVDGDSNGTGSRTSP